MSCGVLYVDRMGNESQGLLTCGRLRELIKRMVKINETNFAGRG